MLAVDGAAHQAATMAARSAQNSLPLPVISSHAITMSDVMQQDTVDTGRISSGWRPDLLLR